MGALLALGAVIVVVTAGDVFLTVMHPTRRGPLSFLVTRGTFSALRGLARLSGRPGALGPAGPTAMIGVFVVWVLLFWVGYALVYLSNMADLSYSSTVDYDDRDLLEALYFSGTSLSTVGFGDIVGETDGHRLVSILEAATGFAVFTAAITYLLSIYPRVSSNRASARTVHSQAEDPRQAAAMVRGEAYLVSVQQQLVGIDEHTERFPILFFFHSKDASASLHTFLRGAAMLCLSARWAIAADRVPHARRHGEELEQSLGRMIDHYTMRFMHGHGPEDLDRRLERDDARRRLALLVDAAGADGDRGVLDDDEELASFSRFAGRCEQFLEHVAGQHLHEHRPLPAA